MKSRSSLFASVLLHFAVRVTRNIALCWRETAPFVTVILALKLVSLSYLFINISC
jgi:hypothetical protein